jgi:hypothetical protein
MTTTSQAGSPTADRVRARPILVGAVTGDDAAGRNLAQRGNLGPAGIDREQAPRVERAAGRRGSGVRRVAGQDDPDPPGGGVHLGHGRAERERVRMGGLR